MKTFLTVLFLTVFSGQAQALRCFGTEPFWGAELEEKEVLFDAEGIESLIKIDRVSAPVGMPISFSQTYYSGGTPVAVVSNGYCDDGMSDFTYGQSAYLFINGQTFYGCCGEAVSGDEN